MAGRKPPKGFGLSKVQMVLKNVPRTLRDKFKGYCARRGMSMTERLVELMRADVNKEIEAFKDEKYIRRNTE